MTDEKPKRDDPWDGWPDEPWLLDGYTLDDAICDEIERSRRHDASPAEKVLERLLESIRSRRFDHKPGVHFKDTLKGE